MLERYQREPSRLHLFSLLGAVVALSGPTPTGGEADFREDCPEFDRLREAFEKAPAAGFWEFLESVGLDGFGEVDAPEA